MMMSLMALASLICLALVIVVVSYNRLQALDSRCDKAAADVDVQLKHRHQLIPNLLELLKGFLANETKQLDTIAQMQIDAMKAASPQARMQAEEMLSSKVKQIVLAAGLQVPQLHANSHFVNLCTELTDCENKISAARRFYNLAVDEYNSSLRSFPNDFLSRTKGMKARNFFDLGLDRPVIEEGPVIKF